MALSQFENFDDPVHLAITSVWWSGILLKQRARKFFAATPLASEAQFNVLMLLKYAPHRYSQRELSERLFVDKSNLTGLIDRLEKCGFVRRCPATDDRRRYTIELTAAGLDLINQIEEPYREQINQLMQVFNPTELQTLISLLEKLQRQMLPEDSHENKITGD